MVNQLEVSHNPEDNYTKVNPKSTKVQSTVNAEQQQEKINAIGQRSTSSLNFVPKNADCRNQNSGRV